MKLGLLRWLAATSFEEPPLRLGVVWYLTPDESHNADGKHVAYVLSIPRDPYADDDGTAWTELHVADGPGAARPFVAGEVNVSGIAWTPDGRSIAYLAKRHGDDHRGVWAIPVDGGSHQVVARATGRQAWTGNVSVDPEKDAARLPADADVYALVLVLHVTGAGDLVVVLAPAAERRELQERRALVDDGVDAVADHELAPGEVSLRIYDVQGREVRRLVDDPLGTLPKPGSTLAMTAMQHLLRTDGGSGIIDFFDVPGIADRPLDIFKGKALRKIRAVVKGQKLPQPVLEFGEIAIDSGTDGTTVSLIF